MTGSEQDDVLNRWRATRLVDTVASIKSGAWGAEPASGGTLCIRIADFNTDNRAVVFKSRTLREIEKAALPGLLLKSGDLLVEKSGGGDKLPVGRIVMWQGDEEAITSNFISRIRLKSEFLPSYMSRVFQIQYVSGLSRKWLKQSTGIQNLDLANYLRETVPLPDLSEQLLLSRYLDHAELRIAKAIQAKQKMVALLNEQKQVIISELVTRGLDPDVPMKDSGQAWLGQIPAHWDLHRMKSQFDELANKGRPDLPLLAATQSMGVVTKESYGLRTVTATRGLENLKIVEPGDFVISLRSFQGGLEISYANGIISPAYTILRAKEDANNKFFSFLFKSKPFLSAIQLTITGIREGQNVDYRRLGLTMIPIPPRDEQIEINNAIVDRTEAIDRAKNALLHEIELLKEYRNALISDVVTGKKDVRAEAAGLQDVDPAELAQVLSGAVSVDAEVDEDDGTSEVE